MRVALDLITVTELLPRIGNLAEAQSAPRCLPRGKTYFVIRDAFHPFAVAGLTSALYFVKMREFELDVQLYKGKRFFEV